MDINWNKSSTTPENFNLAFHRKGLHTYCFAGRFCCWSSSLGNQKKIWLQTRWSVKDPWQLTLEKKGLLNQKLKVTCTQEWPSATCGITNLKILLNDEMISPLPLINYIYHSIKTEKVQWYLRSRNLLL